MLVLRKFSLALATVGLVMLSSVIAAPQPEPKAVSTDDTKWLLSDAEVFVKVNIKQMMTADLMTKGGTSQLKDAIKKDARLKEILDAADIDITRDVDSIVASASGASAKDGKVLVVIRGKFDQDKVQDALKKSAEKNEKLKLVKEGTTQLYEVQVQENSMYAAFVDKNTIVMTQSKESTVDTVKNGGKKVATISKGMASALSRFTGKESITLALVVNDDLKGMLGKIPQGGAAVSKIQSMNASITLTDAVVLNLAGFTGEAKSAKQIATILDAFKGLGAGMEELPAIVGDILNAVNITSTDEAVKIDLKVTKEMIDKAAKSGGK